MQTEVQRAKRLAQGPITGEWQSWDSGRWPLMGRNGSECFLVLRAALLVSSYNTSSSCFHLSLSFKRSIRLPDLSLGRRDSWGFLQQSEGLALTHSGGHRILNTLAAFSMDHWQVSAGNTVADALCLVKPSLMPTFLSEFLLLEAALFSENMSVCLSRLPSLLLSFLPSPPSFLLPCLLYYCWCSLFEFRCSLCTLSQLSNSEELLTCAYQVHPT